MYLLKSLAEKGKEFKKANKIGNVFISYIHNFVGHHKVIVALRHLQKAENLHVRSRLTTIFRLKYISDYDILQYLADIFGAIVLIEDVKHPACSVLFLTKKKIKTYILGGIEKHFDINKIIEENMNKGIKRIRLITFCRKAKNLLEKQLALCYKISKTFTYHLPEEYGGIDIHAIIIDI